MTLTISGITDPASSPQQSDPADFDAWMRQHLVQLPDTLAWNSIIGHGEAKQQLQGMVEALLNPEALRAVGAALPRGLILHGDPGTGKTLSARTFSVELSRAAQRVGRASVPFYELAASELSPERLGRLGRWSSAQVAPAVLYIDEIELWALDRTDFQHNPETRAQLFAALSAIDGLSDTSQVIWVASVNRAPSSLDAALRRPGRLGYAIGMAAPPKEDIEALIRWQLGRRTVIGDIPMDEAVALMDGDTQAAIVQALDDGAMLSLGAGETGMTWPHLRTAMLRRGRIYAPTEMDDELRLRICVHEAAHAIVGSHLWNRQDCVAITIRDVEYGGRTHWRHQRESDSAHSSQHPLNQAVMALAGITAEGEILGNESMGGGADVDTATAAIMSWIRWGVSPEFGRIGLDQLDKDDRGPAILNEYNAITRQKLAECQRTATRLVHEQREQIVRLATILYEGEGQLAGDQLQDALAVALGDEHSDFGNGARRASAPAGGA